MKLPGVDRRRRAADLLLTLPGFFVVAPFVGVTALLIRCQMGSPVFFRQDRAGLHGEVFTIVKFRTMATRTDSRFDPADDAVRLTPLGARLRRLSIDELPQIWNVVRGDMALVGPRPLPNVYTERYSAVQSRRLDVRPGLTGLAQVSGRNGLSWERKLALDVEYVERRSVGLDLRIIWRTILGLAHPDGIGASGHATMPEFVGGSEVA